MIKRKFIGDRAFYSKLMTIFLPILVQNIISNFVNLLDNIMVGRVGTESMSGVAIVNQLLFIFNLCIFGGIAGAGIFTAQYYGKGDNEGVRSTMRMKLYIAAASLLVFEGVFIAFGENLVKLFLHDTGSGLDPVLTLEHAKSYMAIMLIGLPPFAIANAYSGTLRETGEAKLPMIAGLTAVFTNLILNYILIFGKLGLPALGVNGAAIATVISRFIETGIIMVFAHSRTDRCPYIPGLYSSLRIPAGLVKQIVIKGTPLLVNEVLWSAGITTLNQCYSTRGLEVVPAVSIASTVSNVFFCSCLAMGTVIGIMVGQDLGSGDTERAVADDNKLIFFSVSLSACIAAIMAVLAPLFPEIYNTTPEVKAMACKFLYVTSAMFPFMAFTNCSYFTLRSGGKTVITFLFDSVFVWVVCVPTAILLSRVLNVSIIPMYIIVSALEFLKCIIGFVLVSNRSWVNNLVAQN